MKPGGYYLRLEPSSRPEERGPVQGDGGWSLGGSWGIGRGGPRLEAIDLGEAGLLLGTLYENGGVRVVRPHPAAIGRWRESGGDALLRDHWGSYLAILRTTMGLLVLRDPSGTFPCYWIETPRGMLLVSDVAWAEAAGHRFSGIEWTEIHTQLQFHNRRSARTALRGMQELVPGCALRIGGTGTTIEPRWSPYDHVHARPPDFDEAADRVRNAARIAVSAQARRYERPLIALSGGLDSSIVTACVAEAAPGAQCLTFTGGVGDMDETRHARAVAGHFGMPIHIEPLDRDAVDLCHSSAADLPIPSARSFSEAEDRQACRVAEAIGADAFFLGNGGDNIFWYFNTATAALDRLRADGIKGFFETAGDLSRLCDVSATEILFKAVRRLGRHRIRPWAADISLLAGPALVPVSVGRHPWEAAPAGTPLGVQAYVRALIQLQDHHGYFDREAHAPVHSALIAQPLFEACLNLPSWLSCRAGRNRAVARAAFADSLPAAILDRQSKGGFGGFGLQVLDRHLEPARDLLLDGRLADEGLLDRRAVEQLLRDGAALSGAHANRLLRLVAIEAWLQAQRARGRG